MWDCNSRDPEECEHCAKIRYGDDHRIVRNGIFHEKAVEYDYVFLTLTAPSFGKVHQAQKPNTKKGKCVCGAPKHEYGDGVVGTPVDWETYDYEGGVVFNDVSKKLRNHFHTKVELYFGEFAYFSAVEWQARRVIHYHEWLRFPKGKAPSKEALESLASRLSVTDKQTGRKVVFGTQIDYKKISSKQADPELLAYTVKGAVNYTVKGNEAREAEFNGREKKRFESKLWAKAQTRKCGNVFCDGNLCPKKKHQNYGASNTYITCSRGNSDVKRWSFDGLTKKRLRQERWEWVQKNVLGVEPGENNLCAQKTALAVARMVI